MYSEIWHEFVTLVKRGTLADDRMRAYSTVLQEALPRHLQVIREKADWREWQVSPETHLRLLEGSDHVVLALDPGTGAVVGYITAISDGVLTAHIPLLEVLPDYQGAGIGSELVRRMLEQLGDLYAVDLLCDTDVQPFYARLGMRPAPAMMVRNYERQSGSQKALQRKGARTQRADKRGLRLDSRP